MSTFRHQPVTLQLPVIPRRYVRGDRRNFRRWHAWVDAVRVLAEYFKADAHNKRRGRRRG